MVAESQGERIMVPGKRQSDQDQEGGVADTARDADLLPRMHATACRSSRCHPSWQLRHVHCQASLARALAEFPDATGASDRRVQTVSLGVTTEGSNLIHAHRHNGRGDLWSAHRLPGHRPADYDDLVIDRVEGRGRAVQSVMG